MKQVVQELMAGGVAAPSTEQYLFMFLKFMQSVIPTIEFDNTINVQMKKRVVAANPVISSSAPLSPPSASPAGKR